MRQSGVTLIEMLVVMTLIGVMTAISFPAVTAGIDTLRLNQAADGIVTFLNSGLNRAERRQEGVEVTISKPERSLVLRSTDPTFRRSLTMPEGVEITAVLPEVEGADPRAPRDFLLLPGGTVPRIGIALVNRRGSKRIVRVDPITGVPQLETVP